MSKNLPDLDALRGPVASELKTFDAHFRDAMRSRIPLVDLIARYIVRQKGKRVRPMLVLLSAKLCGGVTPASYRAATLIEILHTATLVHDDVVDDADTRRGLASINAVWKNKVAVLMGDYLLSRGLLLSLDHQDYSFLHATSTAVKRMSEGELLQIRKSRQLDNTEETYLHIISDKTASLFSACTLTGAQSATTDVTHHRLLESYGESVGMAFQIQDDLLDYVGKQTIIGKPTGVDIKGKKLTLPLIYALEHGDRKESRLALRMVKKGASADDIRWVLDYVRRAGGIDYARKRANDFAEMARSSISSFPESETKHALTAFVDFVVTRDK
jgi:octaprenyl-diphosphate synthase